MSASPLLGKENSIASADLAGALRERALGAPGLGRNAFKGIIQP
jgi:hypothetical protein